MCVVCVTVASIAVLATTLTTTSCNRSPEPVKENAGNFNNMDLPAWVINPYSELSPGVLAGVGISNKPGPNGPSVKYLIIQAESQARAEIATTLQTEISRMVKDAMQSANIDNISAVESSFSVVTQEVVKNVPLSGAIKDKMFQDKSGIVYVRMIINSEIVKNYLKNNIENYSQAMQNANLSRNTIQKTNASLKHLFDELDVKTEVKTKE